MRIVPGARGEINCIGQPGAAEQKYLLVDPNIAQSLTEESRRARHYVIQGFPWRN